MKAVYLKSIKSPLAPGRFKLKYDYDPNVNVFSQVPKTEEYSEYLEDSFCVNSDYEDTEFLQDDGNDTLMMPQPKSRKKKQQKSTTAKGRTRILKTVDSSSEDEINPSKLNESGWISSQTNNQSSRINKNRIKSSSTSASDESYLVKKSVHGIKRLKSNTSSSSADSDSPVGSRLTQALPFKGRVRQRLQLDTFAKEEKEMVHASAVSPSHSSPPFTRLKPGEDKFQRTDTKNVKTSVSPTSKTVQKDLGSEKEFPPSTSSLSRTASDVRTSQGKTLRTEPRCSSHREPSRGREGDTSISLRTSPVNNESKQLNASSHFASKTIATKTSPQELSREERLKLAKMKQENFRKKQMAERNPTLPPSSVIGQRNNGANLTTAGPGNSSTSCVSAFATPPQNRHRYAKPIILVDSKELSSSQDVLSKLRFKHNMEPKVRPLGTCDYIVSNRMAVERKVVSDFTNGANKARLVSRVRTMLETFDRVTIIIERDRVKGKGADNKTTAQLPILKSKYVEQTISWLSQIPNIKIVFTDNQEETAEILHELNSQESRKGAAIEVPVELSPEKEQVLRFYLSLPRMSYVLALNFLHAFTNLKHFIHCPTASIMSRFQLTRSRVEEMKSHLTREFDQQMLPTSRK